MGATSLNDRLKNPQSGLDSKDFKILSESTEEWEIRGAINRIFKALDFNSDGELSFNEIGAVLQQFLQQKSKADGSKVS